MQFIHKYLSSESKLYFYLNSALVIILLGTLVVGNASQVRNLFGLLALVYSLVFLKKVTFVDASQKPWLLAVLLFGVYHVVHILLLGDPSEHLGNYYKYFFIAIFIIYLSQVGFWLPSLYVGTAIGTLLTLYYGIDEVITTRATHRIGIGHNPIVLATLLLVYIVILAESFFEKRHWVIKFVSALLVIGLIYLIVNTGVRGAYLTLLVLVFVYTARLLYQLTQKQRVYSTLTLSLVAVIFVLWAFGQPAVEHRYERTLIEIQHIKKGDFSTSIGLRLNAWHVAFAMILEKPILGYGEARSEIIEASHVVADEYDIEMNSVATLSHIHSEFLQTWVEYGLLGLICLLLVYAAFIYGLPSQSQWMLFCILAVFLILSITDSGFKNNVLVTTFFVVGSIVRIYLSKVRT